MKKITFNVIVVVAIAALLLGLNQFGLLEASAKFMFAPLLAFYFIGQYAERKFSK